MQPADDGTIRIRLFSEEGRELRRRLVERIAESQVLCARAVRLCSRAKAAGQGGAHPKMVGARAREIA